MEELSPGKSEVDGEVRKKEPSSTRFSLSLGVSGNPRKQTMRSAHLRGICALMTNDDRPQRWVVSHIPCYYVRILEEHRH
jgi:hypothetical protein